MSSLRDYSLLVEGLTQDEVAFRDAIRELDGLADYYGLKQSAMNKLNHHLVGSTLTANDPVNIAAMFDFESETIEMRNGQTYSFSEIDPAYITFMNQQAVEVGKRPYRLPMTEIAMELVDAEFENAENKPVIETNHIDSSKSQQVLHQAFANEMLLMVQLDDFIKDNGLEALMDNHREELMDLVQSHSFDHAFNDAVENLSADAAKELTVS